VAVLGTLTIFLLWKISREFFSRGAGIFAAFLYTTSFAVILHSRWSWNLNPLPFFVLLYIYSFWKMINLKDNEGGWFYLWIFSISIMIQLHASALLFVPVSLILFLIFQPKNLSWKSFLIGGSIFLILNLPLIIYELGHNLENCHKIYNMLHDRISTQSVFETVWHNAANFGNLTNALISANFSGLDLNLLFKNFKSTNASALNVLPGFLLIITLLVFSIHYAIKNKKKRGFKITLLVALLLLPGFLIFQQASYLHYYIIYFPLIFFFMGCLNSFIYNKNIFGKILIAGLTFIIFLLNISYLGNYWASLAQEKRQKSYSLPLYQMKNIVNYIAAEAKNDKIKIKCEIQGYCPAFEYLFALKNIKVEEDSTLFRIYKSSSPNSRFGTLEVEKLTSLSN
jgi:4-amino-4-deoxy-L-arabinose transferase-like glycosyltransferase